MTGRTSVRGEPRAPRSCVVLACLLPFVGAPSASAESPPPAPTELGVPLGTAAATSSGAPIVPEVSDLAWARDLNAIDQAVDTALREKKLPGCVVVIGRRDEILFRRAYGQRALEPVKLPMTLDTVFDIASLTKPVATASSIMVLAERGAIDLDEPVAIYVPAFARAGKAHITIRQVLTHTAGLPADTPMRDYELGKEEALRRIYDIKPRFKPGERFQYSDVGFLVLQEVVQRVSGEDLAAFAEKNVFRPLGMAETGYLPAEALRVRAAPTEYRINAFMQGEAHDPRAYLMGGVAGHAGVFSTATDLSRFAQAMLGEGAIGTDRFLSPKSVAAFTAPHDVPAGIRALGWDMKSAFSTNRGDGFSPRAYGHGGYTGTALWVDPELDLFVVFLSNRVHPDGKGVANPLVKQIATIAASAALARAPGAGTPIADRKAGDVRAGLDVLRDEGFARLRGAKVGLITNVSGRARDGAMNIDLLSQAKGVTLVALFTPEHGLTGGREGKIENAADPITGLPIYSLYGENLRPTAASLAGIDTLVFDIQDIGTRYFTYASTMRRAMETAADNRLRFVVLDRPNPIGSTVGGPMLETAKTNFVNHFALPVRHGMTMGELAELFNADLHLGARLEVVRNAGWHRDDYQEATGLPWINPSPNIRSVGEALLYPCLGLLEATNLSVGRGTATPFEIVGAPFIDGPSLASALEHEGLSGVTFEAADFTPDASIHQGLLCHGVRVQVTDREAFEPVRTGLALARALHATYPDDWHFEDLAKLVGSTRVMDAIRSGKTLNEIEAAYLPEVREFEKKREKYLLYPSTRPKAPLGAP